MARPSRRSPRASERPGWFSAWDRLSDRAQHGVCLLLLLAVSLGFFAPVHFSEKSLIGGDTVNWRAMAESVLSYEEAAGEAPLWATNPFGGMPAYMVSYATEVPQVDDVPRFFRPWLWPTSHFLVLLTGVYLLLVFLTRDKLSGVVAAVAFGLTTYLPVILGAGHNSKFITLAFTPWLVLAFAYALRRPRLLAGLLFAAALAANLRAGHVQITYYVAFLLGIWWVVEGVGALRHGRLKAFGAATGVLALGAFLALAMVAQPYLINAEYKAFTTRGAATGMAEGGGLDWSYAMAWSQGVGELLTLLVAGAFGEGGATYWGPKVFTEGPHYVGGIVILLALLAVWRVRRNAVTALAVAAVLMTLFALGENLPLLNRPMYAYFPLFDAFRVPETWLAAVAFALAVLAGFGLWYATRPDAELEAATGDRPERAARSVLVAAGAVAVFVGLLLLGGDALLDFEKPGEAARLAQQVAAQNNVSPDDPRVLQAVRPYLAEVRQERKDRFSADALRTLLFVVLAGLALVGARRGWIAPWAARLVVGLLVVIDLGGVGRRHLNEDRLVRAPDPEGQIAAYDFDRYLLELQQETGGAGHFRVLSLEGGRDPFTNARPAYFYETLGGYHGAKLRIYQDFIDHVYTQPGTRLPHPKALDLMNVRYVVAPGRLPGMDVVYQGEGGTVVLENPDAVPRAFLVGDVEVVETAEATWERLQSPSFDPRRTAVLPEAPPLDVAPIDSASAARVALTSYAPDEIAWTVATDAPRLLVASEVYYPAGWRAYVDGEEVPILRADYLLRAVPVPAGEHEVVMRFQPARHAAGLWISWLATVLVYGGIAALVVLDRRAGRIPHEPAEDTA